MCGLVVLSTVNSESQVKSALSLIAHRGPDAMGVELVDNWIFGFNRLAIMDLNPRGNQPFIDQKASLVCNGEIYNHKALRAHYSEYAYKSESDCEVILPIVQSADSFADAVGQLDGEFAFCYYDHSEKDLKAARDPMGIRPLFYGYCKKSGVISFASEAKALLEVCDKVEAFPPGHYFEHGQFHSYVDLAKDCDYVADTELKVTERIKELLSDAVIKRLDSDAPIGFLLSGGLDSSLVCAIAAKHLNRPIKTFSIGMKEDAIDLKYAKQVADFIGSDHHEVIIDEQMVLESLEEVIYHLETWDITTIRASIGMYHVCKYIREQTDVKVVLTGEVADEIFGYKYTDFAPTDLEFQKEAQKRVREIYMYDVLRADRSISAHSLEARVPFSDTRFVEYVMSIHPKLKMNTTGHGKFLLRKAFEEGGYLPHSILWREKAAFSDAVGHSLADCIKKFAESFYTDEVYAQKLGAYATQGRPFTKESLLYREIFEKHFAGQSHLIADFWMPNKSWENCDVDDPSARILPNYGASGL